MTMWCLRWMKVLRPGTAAGVIVLTAACDGYPTKDVQVVNPLEMSQAERIEAMNQLGREAQQRGSWRFRLEPGCVLKASVRRRGEGEQSYSIPLQASAVETRFDKDSGMYEVRVQHEAASDAAPLPVLETPRWTDSVEMTSLVRALQRGCRHAEAARPQGR